MEIAGKGGFACYNFNGICILKLERSVVGGGASVPRPWDLWAAERLCVVLADGAFPLVMTDGSDVADHAALMRGCMCSLTLTIMDNFYPPEENYSPSGMSLLLFFLLPIKWKTFLTVSHYKTIPQQEMGLLLLLSM